VNNRLPTRIDRDAFDRVLRRAAELQAHSRDIGESLTEDEVLALGREVGIPEANLRQALLEEQTRIAIPDQTGMAHGWLGAAVVHAERVIQGTPDSIGAVLTRWFEQNEVLVVQRSTPSKITWEPSSSFAGALKRMGWTLSANKPKPYLDRAELVTALITPLEPGFCHLSLVASLRKSRNGFMAGGITLATGVMAVAGIVVAMGAPVLVAPAIVAPGLIGGWAIGRQFHEISARARLGLERALDELERRPALTSGDGSQQRPLVADIGEAVRQITREVKRAFEEKK